MFIHGEAGKQNDPLVVLPEAQDVLLFLLDGFVSGVRDFRQRASTEVTETGLHGLNGGEIVFLRIDFGIHVNDGEVFFISAAAGNAQRHGTQQNTRKQFPHTIASVEFFILYHPVSPQV